jgi:hypothetical protein
VLEFSRSTAKIDYLADVDVKDSVKAMDAAAHEASNRVKKTTFCLDFEPGKFHIDRTTGPHKG